MDTALWIVVALLVVLLGGLQIIGMRALAAYGVRPSKLVIGLRVFNAALVVGILAVAFYVWVR